MAKNIMIQGTASSVGKSITTAALCRIFKEDGYSVAPFKSQNMALNSFVTDEGLEMGRAQVVQAEACGIAPSVLMNPVLLKPSDDTKAQVIIMGKVYSNMSAVEYHAFKPEVKNIVKDAYDRLAENTDVVVLEGAGSPAEINLRENDIVNMGMAELVDAPVILVADIDRGGVFASVVGTIFLLREEEKKRVKGIIINKFRGDLAILQPGIKQLEDIINIPVIGVVPFMEIKLEDEDSVTEKFRRKGKKGEVDICVIKTPRLSNFTDFDVFDLFEDVSLRFASSVDEIGDPDIVIIPGSKNTIEDLTFIKSQGINMILSDLQERGRAVIGICGGFQMLGNRIEDPLGVEGEPTSTYGLGLIDMKTVMEKEKITTQVNGTIFSEEGLLAGLAGHKIKGYEIHMGRSTGIDETTGFTETDLGRGGFISGNVMGTYIHGIFDNAEFTRGLLNNVRMKKGLEPVDTEVDYQKQKEEEFSKLARITRESLDMDKVYEILEGR